MQIFKCKNLQKEIFLIADYELEFVPIELIKVDRRNEKFYGSKEYYEMIDSIKKNGILSPLIVRKVGAHFKLIDGLKRLIVATTIGLKLIPIISKREN